MLWLVRAGAEEAEQALRSAPATRDDLADAALLPPRLGAARLYRRRLLRAQAARVLEARPKDVVIERMAHGGQRILSPRALFASLASRGEWLAIAVSDRPIGVDVETVPTEQPLPVNLLHPREQAVLAGLAGEARETAFLRFWTAREAYVKAAMRGLSEALSTIEARDAPGGEGVLLIEAGAVRAHAAVAMTKDLIAAVVELGGPE